MRDVFLTEKRFQWATEYANLSHLLFITVFAHDIIYFIFSQVLVYLITASVTREFFLYAVHKFPYRYIRGSFVIQGTHANILIALFRLKYTNKGMIMKSSLPGYPCAI